MAGQTGPDSERKILSIIFFLGAKPKHSQKESSIVILFMVAKIILELTQVSSLQVDWFFR
jgi:hypothetical protein